jgi:hypothetical protein
MIGTIRFPRTLLAAVAMSTLALAVVPRPAAAAVVCETAGVPKGCVAVAPVAPVATAVVATPAVGVVRPRVYGPRVYGRVGYGRIGRVGNRGGPVNRIGRL